MADRPQPRDRVALTDRILGLLPPFLNYFGDRMIWLIRQIKSGLGWIMFVPGILRIMITGSLWWKRMRKKQGKRIG